MSWLSRIRNVFRSDRLNDDLEEELQFHIASRARDLGVSEAEVRTRFGNTLRLREESRDAKVSLWLDTFRRDLLTALRLWRKRPAVAVAAILTIALGAGLNIAMLQVLWMVLLKPLPYLDPARLVQVWIDDGKEERNAPPVEQIDDWAAHSRTLKHFASYRAWRVTVASGGEPQQVNAALISAGFFQALGVPMISGRAFTPAEVREGTDNVVLLRESFWRSRFLADQGILGREVSIDGMPCRVAGIVPDSFSAAIIGVKLDPNVYLPISRARVAGMRIGMRSRFLIARLEDEISMIAARDELSGMWKDSKGKRVWLSPVQQEIGRNMRPALMALFAATACVFLIACANLANLMMGQAMLRRRELSIRAALGAGQGQIFRQLLTETSVLLVAGAATGAVLAQAVLHSVAALYPDGIPRTAESGSLLPVYIVSFGLILAIGLLFGCLPAWRATQASSESSLRTGGTFWMNRGNRRLADWMVALQVGLTAVVLISSGISLKSFVGLRGVTIGVERDHVITASVDLPGARYKTRDDRAAFGDRWLQQVQGIPGIASAAISNSLPLRYTTLLDILVQLPGSGQEQKVPCRAVSGDYFTAIGLQFIAGQPFDKGRKGQVVVNEAFVRKFLPAGVSAVGAMLGNEKNPMHITGVVRDVRHLSLREAAQPEIYLPFASFPLNPIDTVVRSTLPAATIEAEMRKALRNVDNQVAVARFMTMDQVVDEQLAQPRFQAILISLFAAVALTLAAVGAYGVIAQMIRSRVPEFALRRALGASTGNLLQLILTQSLRAPLLGLVCGVLAGVYAAAHYLKTLLYNVTPGDPALILITIAVLLGTALLASLLPARKAVQVHPGEVLRQD